ncbi:MAG: NTP/NDP exchange transporter [Legionellales bacterium]|nr:NTP/NDP exchange transporter [Legionellales bacterium]
MSNNEQATPVQFSKLRTFFWPVHNYELKKIIPMLLMFFFISFNYSLLRNLKDALVINAAGSPGAQIIPYLKFWGVIPCAILFMILFSKLSNTVSKKNLFYCSLIPFAIFFALFGFVLYPMKGVLHPLHLHLAFVPEGLQATIRIWTYSLFYIFAELWGSVALSLLFWGFANDTTKLDESKRFYPLFGLGANVALIFSGKASHYFAQLSEQNMLQSIMSIALVVIACVVAIYWWINKYVLTDPRFYDPSKIKKKKKKTKMKLTDSFKLLFHSKYLMYIAILVVVYGVSINLLEVTWKDQVRTLYPNTNEYLSFMGTYSTFLAWTTMLMMLFFTNNIIRTFGWGVAAAVTPIIMLITGAGFFGILIAKDHLTGLFALMGTTPLMAAVFFGTCQNVISKAAKYSLFDPTKEMTYIPLDDESKVKGKAAIDIVGARLGKAGSSVIQQGMFMLAPLSVMTPYIGVLVAVFVGIWLVTIVKLNKEFATRTDTEITYKDEEADSTNDTAAAVINPELKTTT